MQGISKRKGMSTAIGVVFLLVGLLIGAAAGYAITSTTARTTTVVTTSTVGGIGTLTTVTATASTSLPSRLGISSPIKVGVLEPLSGAAAGPGQGIVDAIELAAAQINASGGIDGQPVKLIVDDVQTDPQTALNDLQNLYSVQGVQVAIGPLTSQQVLTVEQYATQNHILLISSSATAGQLTNSSAYFFRTIPSDNLQAQATSAYINAKGYQKVAIVTTNDAFGQGLANSLKAQLGSKIVTTILITSGQTDYTSQMEQVKAANPDAIFYDEFTSDSIVIFKNALSLGMQNIPALGGVELEDPSLFADQQAATYMYDTNLSGPSLVSTENTAPYISFANAFQSKFGSAPGIFAANSYDAAMILFSAIAKAGAYNATSIREQVVPVSLSYVGPSGYMAMNNQGDITQVSYTFYYVIKVNATSYGFATFGSYSSSGGISLSG